LDDEKDGDSSAPMGFMMMISQKAGLGATIGAHMVVELKRMTMITTRRESKLLTRNIYPIVPMSSLPPGMQFLGQAHHFDPRLK
jgi:hypothetical protein